MPRRSTKRGAERTPLDADADVLICGASFAGLAIARELAGARTREGERARVLMVDRYDVGEKQTSACGMPTGWLQALDLPEQQRFDELVIHTPRGTWRMPLPWTFSTFDYRTVCDRLREQGDADFEHAKVEGRTGDTVHTDRGDLRAPLIVDGLGWRRILALGANVQPPEAFLSRGLEVHPHGSGEELEIWIDPKYVPAGYGWSFPADGEVRVGVGSFDPRHHVKDPTNRLADDLQRDRVRYQGNWIPHRIRPAVEDGIFFVGDSAGHCIPLTAEGIRTALYFGIAAGRELRAVVDGRQTREQALAALRRLLRRPPLEVRGDAQAGRTRCRASRRACSPACSARWRAPRASPAGPSSATCNIAHPDFAGPAPAAAPARRREAVPA